MSDGMEGVRPERRARILDERTRELARRRIGPAAAERQGEPYLVCVLGRDRVALPVTAVAGVLPERPCAPLPGARPEALGLFGHEGRTATAADLRTALGLAPADGAPKGAGAFVMLRGTEPRLALRVDAVQAVQRLAMSEPAEAMGRESGTAFAAGYAPIATPSGPALVTLLDAERLARSLLSSSPAPGA